MFDESLFDRLVSKIHLFLGTKSVLGYSGDLDIVSALSDSYLKIDNTETYFSLLNQRRLSCLNFASFDSNEDRKNKFLYEALNLCEEQISLCRFDQSFPQDKKLFLYFVFFRICYLIAKNMPENNRNDILVSIIHVIDTLETSDLFLKSWFEIFKVRLFFELGYLEDSRDSLPSAKKMYLQNFSEHYFEFQSEYGQVYWTDEVKDLESLLKKR